MSKKKVIVACGLWLVALFWPFLGVYAMGNFNFFAAALNYINTSRMAAQLIYTLFLFVPSFALFALLPYSRKIRLYNLGAFFLIFMFLVTIYYFEDATR